MNEIINIEQSVQYTPAVIVYNKQELLNHVEPIVAKYTNLVVTDDNLDEAKKSRTELKKVFDKIDIERKAIKNKFNEPLKFFELEVKECTDKITTCIADIDKQLDVYEVARLDAKRKDCQNIINQLVSNSLEDKYKAMIVFNEKWLNKTSKIKDITIEIEAQVLQLVKQQDNEKELAQLKAQQLEQERKLRDQEIVRRTELLNKLNSQYMLNLTYNQVEHLTDIQCIEKMEQLYLANKNKAEQQVVTSPVVEPVKPAEPDVKQRIATSTKLDGLIYEFTNTTEEELTKIFTLIQAKFKHITIRKI
jgi:hypothetical protein